MRIPIALRRFLMMNRLFSSSLEGGGGGNNPLGQSSKPSTIKEKLRDFFKKYGKTGLMYYSLISTTSIASIYTIISMGVDVPRLISKITGKESKAGSWMDKAGGFAIAYAIHKTLLPIRLLLTVGVTKWAYGRGWRWENLKDRVGSYFRNRNQL